MMDATGDTHPDVSAASPSAATHQTSARWVMPSSTARWNGSHVNVYWMGWRILPFHISVVRFSALLLPYLVLVSMFFAVYVEDHNASHNEY